MEEARILAIPAEDIQWLRGDQNITEIDLGKLGVQAELIVED
jgi:hypothetical protein